MRTELENKLANFFNGIVVKEVNEEYVLNSNANKHNKTIWDERINKFNKMKNVKFYLIVNEDEIEKFIVSYENRNLRFIDKISYNESLSNGGFSVVEINNYSGVDILTQESDFEKLCESQNVFLASKTFC